MESYKFIKLNEDDKVFSLTLNREDTNLLHIDMMAEITAALLSLSDGRGARALVIRAAGRAFSAGLDYSEADIDSMERLIHPYHKMFRLLDRLECPTIAYVQGAALGAGCELACFCDMVLASEAARFGLPEIKLGLFPPLAAADFYRYGHLKHIAELMMVGDSVSADEAKLMGLVNHVFPASEFDSKCREFLYRLTSNPSAPIRLAKRAMRTAQDLKFSEALSESEGVYLRELMKCPETREGLGKYRDKSIGD
jgi:cyclohexa-1,5-dienecarbonyl-CoA hydratase